MREAVLQRIAPPGLDPSEGTPGILREGSFVCTTGELPWVDANQDGKRDASRSRIAAGKYLCAWGMSPSRKNADGTPEYTYRLKDVPDAEGVLIHKGNFCGDVTKGFVSDVLGCIILGADWSDINIPPTKIAKTGVTRTAQKGVSASGPTVAAFVAHMGKEPFWLIVLDPVVPV